MVRKTWTRWPLLAGCSLLAVAGTSGAEAAGTRAGTVITNTATATYDDPVNPGGAKVTTPSNQVDLKVDELLDIVVTGPSSDVTAQSGSTNQVIRFTLTNAGNGEEAVKLAVDTVLGGDDFDPTSAQIHLDTNGNGVYDPGADTLYTPGSNEPVLDPDQTVSLFVVASMPRGDDGDRGQVKLTGTAATGSGTAGSVFAGQGQGGGDAVVGSTTATDDASGYYQLSAAVVNFLKSATVLDPFGGSEAVPGAIVTYSLRASIVGSGSLANFKVSDIIPTATSYRAGSLKLDGASLSDAADSDAGNAGASGVAVGLGTVTGGASHTVTFQVVID